MRDDLVIRRERPADHQPTMDLHDAAFGVPAGRGASPQREVLQGLRADGSLIDELTFVAELEGEVVGHVVCSRAALAGAPTVGVGPLGVRPAVQQQGIGAALLMAVVASADRIAEPVLVLHGDPEYFGFFGFRAASALGITPLEAAGDTTFQALPLRAWRARMAGDFRYPSAWRRLR